MTSVPSWPGPPVHVIGLGVELGDGLHREALIALDRAEIVIGADRHLAAFPHITARRLDYPSPMSELQCLLRDHAGRHIVLLASGDPLFFGIGDYLIRHLGPEQLIFHPNISSIQAAFSRLKRPWQHARILSLHGRPLDSLRATLQANRLYALLTDQASKPSAIARLLCETGFADSQVWVAEDLGSDRERISDFRASALKETALTFSPLNVVIVETLGPGGLLPEFPGIPDEHFVTDDEPGKGMLSKREVRLTILSLLAPRARETGWDVGAGCGGVSVEWARWNPYGEVYAVEYHAQRLQCLEANRQRFGVVRNLNVVAGYAPAALGALPDPHTVFVGGSRGQLLPLLDAVWARLIPGGHLVVSAVTEDTRMDLHRFAEDKPAYWTQISVARGDQLAGQRVLRPYLPVLLGKMEKPRR